jgi:hypothetical protein
MRKLRLLVVMVAALVAGVLPGADATEYGDLEFPRDEHQHLNGWDYWWGAADLVMEESGNHYTVGLAFVSFNGVGATGHQIYPHQGPYEDRTILTADGPTEWGHPEQQGEFVRDVSVHVPGVSDLLRYSTLDANDGLKDVGRWERTTLDSDRYHLLLDHGRAEVHPTGERVRALVDIEAEMRSPLLAGGTGRWWYGIPETYGYPSRSFQYMQASRQVSGTMELEQPDGTMLVETVDADRSTILMVHEYDATPEDLFAGLAMAEATQLHPRYPQYYQGGMPWELIFLDLDNEAQLMVAVLAFHDTPNGLAPRVGIDQPTYRVMATLRLPSGVSVPLDDVLDVEHLSYRNLVGRVPTFGVAITGLWTQTWDYRIRYPGGTVTGPDGADHAVPPFDLGVVPQIGRHRPGVDTEGNGQTQRVPFVARGSYDGCPVTGFGWSELITNWYGRESDDPWWTGRDLPAVPAACGSPESEPHPDRGDLDPPGEDAPPNLTWEGCHVFNPGTPACEYTATTVGGVGGYSDTPGGWTVTIHRPGRSEPIVITGLGASEEYACGTIRPGDMVSMSAEPGAGAFAGNPGICF